MIHTFLLALHKLEDPTVMNIFFSALQAAVYSLLDCIIIIEVLASHVIFQNPEEVIIWGVQVWTL